MTLKVSGWFPFGYFHSALDSILFCLSMNTFFSCCYIKSSCQAVVWPWLYICMLSCSLVADSFRYYGLYPASLLPPWDPPGNTGVGFHFLLMGIIPTQVSNLSLMHLLHWQMGFLFLTTGTTWEAMVLFSSVFGVLCIFANTVWIPLLPCSAYFPTLHWWKGWPCPWNFKALIPLASHMVHESSRLCLHHLGHYLIFPISLLIFSPGYKCLKDGIYIAFFSFPPRAIGTPQ